MDILGMRVTHHLWTLNRPGKTTSCVIIRRTGAWVLRLTCNGRCVLDSSCESLGEAVAQSRVTFAAFLTRGWIGATDLAEPRQGMEMLM